MEETKMLQAIRGIFREELEPVKEELKGEISELREDVCILQGDVKILQSDMNNLKDRVSNLEVEVKEIREETANLREEVTGLHEETASLREEFRQNLEKTEKNILEVMRKEIRASENSTLEEVDRLQEIMERQIREVNGKVDNLEKYYRISRLENDNTTLVLQIVEDYGRRLEKLERVIA